MAAIILSIILGVVGVGIGGGFDTVAAIAREALLRPVGEPNADGYYAAMERELLSEDVGEMIVTPREIDALIVDAAGIIASGLNRALHPGLSDAEIAAMMD